MAARKYHMAAGRVLSQVLRVDRVISAAEVNVAQFVTPQKCIVVGITAWVDVKTAITVLSVMAEAAAVNLLSAVIDLNAPAVKTPTAGTLNMGASDLGIEVEKDVSINVDVDAVTGTSFQGLSVQIDYIPLDS